jgi:hypothetical protein
MVIKIRGQLALFTKSAQEPELAQDKMTARDKVKPIPPVKIDRETRRQGEEELPRSSPYFHPPAGVPKGTWTTPLY